MRADALSKNTATIIGLSAVLLWASIVGFIRKVNEALGPDLAVTLIYTLSALLLLVLFRTPKFHTISKPYFIIGGILFVACELSFSYALTYATDSQQAVEANIINYLWPSLTILFLVIAKELSFKLLLIPGLIISFCGIAFSQLGSDSLNIDLLLNNIKLNPICYLLAISSAVTWSCYSTLTKKLNNGQNLLPLFTALTALTLWLKIMFSGQHLVIPNHMDAATLLFTLLTALAFSFGYAAWNIGLLHGNITVMTAGSFFTPIISSLFAMLLLDIQLSAAFWQGTVMVTCGSLICWYATKPQKIDPDEASLSRIHEH